MSNNDVVAATQKAIRRLAGAIGSCSMTMQHVDGHELRTVHVHERGTSFQGHRAMIEVELADAVIRIADLCGALGLDLGGAIDEKLAYHAQREDHKIEVRQRAGGKRY